MTPRITQVVAASALVALAPLTATAQDSGPSSTPYVLEGPSSFAWGCFDLCACPIVQAALKGTFTLTRQNPDPLYEHYTVSDVQWLTQGASGPVPITGSGTYRVGGEFAVQQQMTLDLAVAGGAPQHFDSGLVLGGGEFPNIAIQVRLHLTPHCVDTLFTLRATPAVSVAGVEPVGGGPPQVSPNPFRSQARMDFAVPTAGPVDVQVLDLGGRVVRRLVSREWLEAGTHSITWDGRRDDGGEAPAGLYYVRMRSGGRDELGKVIKLR